MIHQTIPAVCRLTAMLISVSAFVFAQQPPYDVFPPAEPPIYRVRYEASTQPGELSYPVNYTIWIPKDVKSLRGVIVHQHGCGEGSCKSGLTGAYDLHWQALAKKHDCALLAPAYEQPEKADCQLWCDPRHGSSAAFQRCLVDLGAKSGHPELSRVPWALWGHSGGGHWAGGMVLLHPDRVAAAWLRSGVPLLKPDPERLSIKPHSLPDAALQVPVMCNPGTKEGVTVKDGRFAGVWPANEAFFSAVRERDGLISVAVDPLTGHECGNQRYFAIPWLDACLRARLPNSSGDPLQAMPTDNTWLAIPTGSEAVPAASFLGDPKKAAWLPNESIARAWMEYVKDTAVTDTTPPPAATSLTVKGNELSWEVEADLESGLAGFIIERDGQFLANLPEKGAAKNPFGRPLFQNLQYSDTPTQPLVPLRFTDTKAEPGQKYNYRVVAVNTVGLKSQACAVGFNVEMLADKLVITAANRPVAEFVFRDPKILRPFFANVHTPGGLKITRHHPPQGNAGDATDHDTMHPGIWFGFGDMSGHDFWRNRGRIEHVRFTTAPVAASLRDAHPCLSVSPELNESQLEFATDSILRTADGKSLCRLECKFLFKPVPSSWLIVWDATFHADDTDISFGDQEEMGFGARLATPLIEKNGGRIMNSQGQQTAAKTWGQPAGQWCDYEGTSNGQRGGITLIAASSNFRTSWWHSRDYGLLVANPFGRAAMKQGARSSVTVKRGESFHLRFAAVVHDGPYQPASDFAEVLSQWKLLDRNP